MTEQWLEQWLREWLLWSKCRPGTALPGQAEPFRLLPSHTLFALWPPSHPTPFRWAGLTRQLSLAVLPEATRPPVQLHLFPGETQLLATRECWIWSPELWLSPAGLESGVTDCLWRRVPGSLILIMIDGKSSRCYSVLLWHEIKDKPRSILR